MNNNTNETQENAKLDLHYKQEARMNNEYGYIILGQKGSEHIVWAKHAMDNLIKDSKKVKNNFSKLLERYQKLKVESDKKDKRIAELEQEFKVLAAKHSRLKEEYQKFAKNKGQGRPRILTESVKKAIQKGVQQGQPVIEIHRFLEGQGLEVSYEAVRKYISHGKATGDWR